MVARTFGLIEDTWVKNGPENDHRLSKKRNLPEMIKII